MCVRYACISGLFFSKFYRQFRRRLRRSTGDLGSPRGPGRLDGRPETPLEWVEGHREPPKGHGTPVSAETGPRRGRVDRRGAREPGLGTWCSRDCTKGKRNVGSLRVRSPSTRRWVDSPGAEGSIHVRRRTWLRPVSTRPELPGLRGRRGWAGRKERESPVIGPDG